MNKTAPEYLVQRVEMLERTDTENNLVISQLRLDLTTEKEKTAEQATIIKELLEQENA